MMTAGVEYVRRIREYLHANFVMSGEPEEIPTDVSLLREGIVDSYGFVELTAWIESEFGFKIDDEELTTDNLGSIERMARFVAAKVNGAPTASLENPEAVPGESRTAGALPKRQPV